MKSEQVTLKQYDGTIDDVSFSFTPTLLLVFAGSSILKGNSLASLLKQKFTDTIITGCSTAGEIGGTNVSDDTVVITAIKFDKTKLVKESIDLEDASGSLSAGKELMSRLSKEDLKHVFVLSDGLNVNGTQLVSGMRSVVPDNVSITGGLAGDGANFINTYIIDDGDIKNKSIVAIGFYGNDLKVGYGSLGGWDSFGLDRLVTKSEDNVLYELDEKPALELYKSFLGEQAKGLPASGLLFPLSMRVDGNEKPVVRTILAIDEDEQSLTFAGDIPEGAYVRLMKANVDRLINGAEGAAKVTKSENNNPELAILISCVGRKLVLKQLVEEEVEAVQDVVGSNVTLTGFYSYGEIAPFMKDAKCELHNQTMTITTFSES